jgi:hypothetical protein
MSHDKVLGGIFLIVVWWPFLIPALLGLRQEVRIVGDLLVAKSWFNRTTWRRDVVDGFVVVRPRWIPNYAWLALELRSGGRRRLPGTLRGGYGALQRRLERQRDILDAWRQSPSPPHQ